MEFRWTGEEQHIDRLFNPARIAPNILYIQGQDAKIAPVSEPTLSFRGIAIGYAAGDEPQVGRAENQPLLEGRVLIADAISIAEDFNSEGMFPRLSGQQAAEQFFRAALRQNLTVDWW